MEIRPRRVPCIVPALALAAILFAIGCAHSGTVPIRRESEQDRALNIARKHFWGKGDPGEVQLVSENQSTWRIATPAAPDGVTPALIAVVDKATGACRTEVVGADAHGSFALPFAQPLSSQDHKYLSIAGVRMDGRYLLRDSRGISISDALKLGGGPWLCESCYHFGGESRVWNLARPAYVTRGKERHKVDRKDWSSWLLLPGDVVYFSHVPL